MRAIGRVDIDTVVKDVDIDTLQVPAVSEERGLVGYHPEFLGSVGWSISRILTKIISDVDIRRSSRVLTGLQHFSGFSWLQSERV